MARLKIPYLYANCDYTLYTLDADGAYLAAAGVIGERTVQPTADVHRYLMAQFHALVRNGTSHNHKETVREEIAHTFMQRVKLIDDAPEEAYWSRFAAFMHTLHYFGTGLFDVRECGDCAMVAESVFWTHIAASSQLYPDTFGLIAAARANHASVRPVTSSDVRIRPSGRTYCASDSTAHKLHRVERVLGRFLSRPIVFEEHRKASRAGWERYVLPTYSEGSMRVSAILSNSLGGVEAGVTMDMPVRILLDRDGVYVDKPRPEAATHIVRSLDEVPAILGWV